MAYEEISSVYAFDYGERDEKGKPINVEAGAPKWFNPDPPPAIGAKVRANFNNLGLAVVIGYFVEENYLGLLVAFDDPPAFFVKQNKKNKGHLFGPEFDLKGV